MGFDPHCVDTTRSHNCSPWRETIHRSFLGRAWRGPVDEFLHAEAGRRKDRCPGIGESLEVTPGVSKSALLFDASRKLDSPSPGMSVLSSPRRSPHA